MKKTFSVVSLLVILAMVLGACAQPTAAPLPTAAPALPTAVPAQPTAAPAQPTAVPAAKVPVGIVLPTKDEPRWIQDETRFKDALLKAGYEVQILFSQGDSAKEKANVEALISQGIQVLIICPQDGTAAAAAADEARAAGVKVISYDRLIRDTEAVDYYVTFDSVAVGAAWGDYLVSKASGTGNNLYLYAGASSDNNAFLFFQGAWSKLQPKIADGTFVIKNSSEAVALQGKAELSRDELAKIIGQVSTNWDFNTAKNLAEANLTAAVTADKGTVFIVAPNDGTARAIADAFAVDKDVKTFYVTGQDAEKASVQYIIDGKQSMTVLKDVRTLVADAITAAVAYLKGGTPEKTNTYNNGKIEVPAKPSAIVTVTKDNVQAALIDSGYYQASDFTNVGAAPAAKDLGLTGPLAGKTWDDLVAMAKGSEVAFWMWGGSEPINKWINGWYATALKDKYGITLKQVPVSDATEFINQVLGEKQAGKNEGGAVDFMWINGENFRTMKTGGLLYGPWATAVPSAAYYNWDDPSVSFDFGYAVDGYEMPWGTAQVVVEYDSARVSNPPTSMKGLVEWIKANPGRFAYPAPPDFTGSVWTRMMCYYATGDYTQFLGEFDQAKFDAAFPACWKLLNELEPGLWRKGETYPESLAKNRELFTNGEIDFNMTYGPGDAQNFINQGLYPKTVKTLVLDDGTIANTNYMAVSYNAAHLAAALVAVNFMASPEVQLQYTKDNNWSAPLDFTKLSPELQAAFKTVDRGAATVPDDILALHKLPELQSPWLAAIEKGWTENVLQK